MTKHVLIILGAFTLLAGLTVIGTFFLRAKASIQHTRQQLYGTELGLITFTTERKDMGIKIKGEGRVYQDGNTEPSGTWKSSGMNQDTLNYDDTPQGPGGTDKGFTWHGGGVATYTSPVGSDLDTALSRFEAVFRAKVGDIEIYTWTEWTRGSINEEWPTLPTAQGVLTEP